MIKIANADVERAGLEAQNEAMRVLRENWPEGACPEVVRNISGEDIDSLKGEEGSVHQLRVLTFVEGDALALVRPRSGALLTQFGSALASMSLVMEALDLPAGEVAGRWDLAEATWITSALKVIDDPELRGIVERLMIQYRARISPRLDSLPRSWVHGDANDENVLCSREDGEWRFSGIVDFGDLVFTHTVNELAIAATYVILDAEDRWAELLALVSAYHTVRPLSANEIAVLFPLVCTRLCVSLTGSSLAALADPENDHARKSEASVGMTLAWIEDQDWTEAEDRIRVACGLSTPGGPAREGEQDRGTRLEH